MSGAWTPRTSWTSCGTYFASLWGLHDATPIATRARVSVTRGARISVLQEVVDGGDDAYALGDLAAFGNSGGFVAGEDLEYPLVGLADPAQRAVGISRELVGGFSSPGRRLGDH